MKTIKLFGAYLLLSMSVILTISCETEAIEAPIQNEVVKEAVTVEGESILHKRYDANLSYDEAKALWNKELNVFKTKNTTRANVNQVFYTVGTKTGTGQYDGTDDEVRIDVYFNTNGGVYSQKHIKLDHKNYDDREGGWDFYLIIFYNQINSLDYISLRSARVKLKGTDGWRLEKLNIEIEGTNQNVAANGLSRLYQRIFTTLDNSDSDDWDTHYTGIMSGTGNVTF